MPDVEIAKSTLEALPEPVRNIVSRLQEKVELLAPKGAPVQFKESGKGKSAKLVIPSAAADAMRSDEACRKGLRLLLREVSAHESKAADPPKASKPKAKPPA